MLFQKESPRWLCERGVSGNFTERMIFLTTRFQRYDEATAVVAYLRGLSLQNPVVQDQINDIKRDFEGNKKLTFTEQVMYIHNDSFASLSCCE
jgi:hypothetical protein